MGKAGVSNSYVWSKRLLFVFFIFLVWFAWFVFFDPEDCRDEDCFYDNLIECNKANFVGGNEMIFEYSIKGKTRGDCEVKVTLLQGELNNQDSIKLEGHSMTCLLPLGADVVPESDISVCNGPLKEGLQDMIIKKLHSYLVENLGRLNLELADIPGI